MRLTGKQIDSKQDKPRYPIQDFGNKEFRCSNCGAKIAELKILSEDPKIESYIKARCPYCDDQSFVKVVQGKFAFIEVDGLKIKDFPMTCNKTSDGNIIQNVTIITEILNETTKYIHPSDQEE